MWTTPVLYVWDAIPGCFQVERICKLEEQILAAKQEEADQAMESLLRELEKEKVAVVMRAAKKKANKRRK